MLVVERRYKIINWRSWVHGPTAAFLADKPLFGDVACELLAFVGDASLVAHNAGFNIAFLNAELKRAAMPVIAPERVVDTLVLAWRKHPGGHNTLDDLYRAVVLIARGARNTARCSTPSCGPRSTSIGPRRPSRAAA
jgi:DNA polymerase III epsilon subunit-like protein